MNDIYRAVYDAMMLHSESMGNAIAIIQQEGCYAASLHATPSAIYRPAISIDGDQWCALYGENLQDGVAGFGDSPALAMEAFNRAWTAKLPKGQSNG